MIALALAWMQEEPLVRTPAIYRCPAGEIVANPHRFEDLVENYAFDTFCIEPAPPPLAKELMAKHKIKTIDAKTIDTPANLAWRNATLALLTGKDSPKGWLEKTAKIKATVHFLTSPKTDELRKAMGNNAPFGEIFLLSWTGTPCLTSSDTWRTRLLPDDNAHLSWVLGMNDWLGPMLYFRSTEKYVVTQKPKIISAPAKPGLFVFQQATKAKRITMYFNTSSSVQKLPKVDPDKATISRGFTVEDDNTARLQPKGIVFVEEGL